VSGALKLYLREAENPLITRESYDKFIEVLTLDEGEAILKLKQYYQLLPKEHQWILIYLSWLLIEVMKYEEVNKMSLQNILIVFGPTVMKDPDPMSMDFTQVSNHTKIFSIFLTHFDEIFGSDSIQNVLESFEEYAKDFLLPNYDYEDDVLPPTDLPPGPEEEESSSDQKKGKKGKKKDSSGSVKKKIVELGQR